MLATGQDWLHRDAEAALEHWRTGKTRHSLVLDGARRVGKTELARRHGNGYGAFIEVNLEREPNLHIHFLQDLDPVRILRALADAKKVRIVPGDTLLFLDEIQAEPKAYAALRYFAEEESGARVVAAGSLLHLAQKAVGTAVGRIRFLPVYPLTFGEFLMATGNRHWREVLLEQPLDEPVIGPIHTTSLSLVKDYLLVGGLPEAVRAYLDNNSVLAAQDTHTEIVKGYRRDFPKYATKAQQPYLGMAFDAVAAQMGRRFNHSAAGEGVRARDFHEPLDLLATAHLLHRVWRCDHAKSPLSLHASGRLFKPVGLDIGLSLSLLGVQPRDWVDLRDLHLANGGAVVEAFVGQEIAAYTQAGPGNPLFHWERHRAGSEAEVDYLLESRRGVLPVEVKKGPWGKLKSLALLMQEEGLGLGVKVSSESFGRHGVLQSVPLYAVERLFRGDPPVTDLLPLQP
ncbi:ATP-binding protein [bacterium]|nr:ATP-binding protein [bacterium]